MARKTVNITDVINAANAMFANTGDSMRQEREGIAALLSRILTDTGNYRGFNYLASERLPDGSLRHGYDPTRVYYY